MQHVSRRFAWGSQALGRLTHLLNILERRLAAVLQRLTPLQSRVNYYLRLLFPTLINLPNRASTQLVTYLRIHRSQKSIVPLFGEALGKGM